MPLRTSRLADHYYGFLRTILLPRLPSVLAVPDRLTCLGLLFAGLAPLGFYVHPLLGFLGIGLSGLSDSLDGLVSRHLRQESRFGAFLDSCFDRASDAFYLLGFCILFRNTSIFHLASYGIFLSYMLTVMISYVKARAEGLGVSCTEGFMERDLRVIYLLLWSLLLGLVPGKASVILLWGGLILYIILTLATVAQRIHAVRGKLAD